MSQPLLYTITWSSNYRRSPKEKIVFGPELEKNVVKLTLTWMFQNNKIDIDTLREITQFDNHIQDDDEDSTKLIEFLISQCNSATDLHNFCNKYGNSYYQDEEGWKWCIKPSS